MNSQFKEKTKLLAVCLNLVQEDNGMQKVSFIIENK